MEKDKKKIIIGAGVLAGAGLAYFLTRKGAAEEPPDEPPPGEDYGRVQGYILDGETGAKIANAEISVDDVFHCYSDYHGLYRTDYIQFGTHVITVKANNYQAATFPVTLELSLMNQDLPLLPLPEAPTEWTDGVQVTKITVNPTIIYLAQSVNIEVYIQYPYPLPLPADIHGSVLVDSVKLSHDWTIEFRNPTLHFEYTPTATGNFLVRAQDKSASFTVLQDVPATYYSPFGGVRMPICTKVVLPNVPSFSAKLNCPDGQQDYTFPGGDIVISGRAAFFVPSYTKIGDCSLSFPYNIKRYIEDHLGEANAIQWSPPEAVIAAWVKYYKVSALPTLIVMSTEYNCREYWDSKEELAKMIANVDPNVGIRIPTEWRVEYGTTCPTCDGTGELASSHSGRPRTCPTCEGTGKVLKVSLTAGIRDWVKPMEIGTNPPVYTGIKYYSFTIECPYCGTIVELDHEQGRVALARLLLNHIEERHPGHPLTAPAWF